MKKGKLPILAAATLVATMMTSTAAQADLIAWEVTNISFRLERTGADSARATIREDTAPLSGLHWTSVNMERWSATGILEETAWIYKSIGAPVEGEFMFEMLVDFVQAGGVWAPTGGTLRLTDTYVPTEDRIRGDFLPTSGMTLEGESNRNLTFTGLLTPQTGDPGVLVGKQPDGTWLYDGDDGTEVNISDPDSYDNGTVFVVNVTVPTLNGDDDDQKIADLFTRLLGEYGPPDEELNLTQLDTGHAEGTIVPTPAALVLGLIGLGFVGWRMRRYA